MSNRLAAETSPYLRQHADNPVDWWPWGAEALAAARAQDKPILLSIGYSACHWCHVMAHESFEDEATARLMNEKFICIKVDREERPDLDRIHQFAHQTLTQRGGGWPLTVFLAPDDLTPFYAGTYFPKEARYGMPPFAHVLEQVRGIWDARRGEVLAQNAALRKFIERHDAAETHAGALDAAPIRAALAQIERDFDPEHGGHRGAPKFPHCPGMELLLDLGAARTREMAELTLRRMAAGGIHDQIGGGFYRYSVDDRWEIPHFEKMLYDNAQLLPLYASAGPRGGDGETAQRIVDWLAREMTAPHGGFHAALDADSDGEEGKYYLWHRDEARDALSKDEIAVAGPYYGFDRPPNFEHAAWNPIVARPLDAIALALGLTPETAQARLSGARRRLFAVRAGRGRPGRDDKVLTSWNALMISGLARAARTLHSPTFAAMAEDAIAALRGTVWRNNRLYTSFDGREARFPAYLDDYAFLLDALLESLQTKWSTRHFDWAVQLADALLRHFEDAAHGGFFFTAHDHEKLIQRPKPFADEALPSGNGVAARALLRLGHLLGETRWLDAAERTLRAARATMLQMPAACATLQGALLDFLHPRLQIVVRSDSIAEEETWRAALRSAGDLRRLDAYFIPDDAGELPGTLAARKQAAGAVACLCRGTQCEAPTGDVASLLARLRRNEAPRAPF